MGAVDVTYRVVDDLPGGVATIWHVEPDHFTVIMSRAATVDEIADAWRAMYPRLTPTMGMATTPEDHAAA